MKTKTGITMITKLVRKILVWNNSILPKAKSRYLKDPWTITTVHTDETITVQCGNKSERMNILRVKPFEE